MVEMVILLLLLQEVHLNCFDYAYQAAKLAMEHITPVILLTDGCIANGAEPWKIPQTNGSRNKPNFAMKALKI